MHHTCGEPCAWVMGKGGHGVPPYEGGSEFNPAMSDFDNTEAYMHRHSITGIKLNDKDGN